MDPARSFSNPVRILPNDFNNIKGIAVVFSHGSLALVCAEVSGVNADRKPVLSISAYGF
jgi:hypothetical protein